MTVLRKARRFKFVSRPAAEPEWKSLHRVADRQVPAFSRVFLEALESLRAQLNDAQLQERLERREPGLVMQVIPFDAMRLAMERAYADLYLKTAASATRVTAPFLERETKLKVRIAKQEGFELEFDASNPFAVSQASRFAAELVREIDQETRIAIREIIERAQREGLDVRAQARLIRERIGLTRRQMQALFNFERGLEARGLSPQQIEERVSRQYNRAVRLRAQTIARTETIKASVAGQQELWRQAADQGLIDRTRTRRSWISTSDSRVCPICSELDGKTTTLEEPFTSGFVGLIMQPPAHPACLPGTTDVSPCGRIVATTERWYDGELAIIRTASGKNLRCTPNHPVLTVCGWLPAGLLNVGCDIVCGLPRQRVSFGCHDDDNYMPTRIEQIAKAFRRAKQVLSAPMPVATKDFHGDGLGSKVAVIWTDRLLVDHPYPAPAEHSSQVPFSGADMRLEPLDTRSPFDFVGKGKFPTSIRKVGSTNLFSTLGGRHTRPFQKLGFGSSADRDTTFMQTPVDSISINTQTLGQRIDRFASKVTLDQVVNIEFMSFHGRVYNLQTESGFYVANGILVHNCRCAISLAFSE